MTDDEVLQHLPELNTVVASTQVVSYYSSSGEP